MRELENHERLKLGSRLTALKSERKGKITLKQCTVEKKPTRTITLVDTRIRKIPVRSKTESKDEPDLMRKPQY
ncbi:MAG: hypothetical protein WCP01_06140 [Methylococcaceae bacterium]